ncbi:hypothetical protein UUR5_B0013 [Ureaplasma urealyticum serovar 5 str. ATCC 27817]|uniref:Uncharacterized protein n=1 Tax=Ureaplasma urealyticum serovar 8 str. ATCC 27618 TaxID=626095 RepID=A0ABM9XJS7_UREUR|nr:hypothetical protein UUR5_B0013 [Ureaplasma urealyticum serovar 5 str. ATCC 27817]EEH01402.1 hypothetical protein UUR8_0342 [Ureaplasma urealyticum serovar 8 str. ATCC 27618]
MLNKEFFPSLTKVKIINNVNILKNRIKTWLTIRSIIGRLVFFLSVTTDPKNPAINPTAGSWIAYIQNQIPPLINHAKVSTKNPAKIPINGPKYQLKTINAIHVKEITILNPGILICKNPIPKRIATKTAKTTIKLIVLKSFKG